MFSLESKIALVTGAGSGIGAAIAQTFARAGATVFVTDRDENTGRETVRFIEKAGGKAEFLALDVSKEEDCARTAKHVHQKHGRLDILVNNAGIGSVGTLLQTTSEDMDRLYNVNVKGVFNVTKAFLADMLARKYGVIVN